MKEADSDSVQPAQASLSLTDLNSTGLNSASPNSAQRKKIYVMLASYNGSNYIEHQVDSILKQQKADVTVRISDDGSQDGTFELLQKRYGSLENVIITQRKKGLGCAGNFMSMIYEAPENYDYYAFSDQDDVWAHDKLIHAVEYVREAEETGKPFVYCSNRDECDSDLNVLYKNLPTDKMQSGKDITDKKYLLTCGNLLGGNTSLFNRKTLALLKEKPVSRFPLGIYRDFWLHMVVAYCGGTVLFDLKYAGVKRRLTCNNTAGVNREKKKIVSHIWNRLWSNQSESRKNIAKEFLSSYNENISEEDRKFLRMFLQKSFRDRFCIAKMIAEVPFRTWYAKANSIFKVLFGRY